MPPHNTPANDASALSLTGEHPIARAIDHLSRPTPAVEWLMSVGPIAKRLNEESQREAGSAQQAPATHS